MYDIPDVEYDTVISIESSEFQRSFKEIHATDEDYVKIVSKGNNFILECDGEDEKIQICHKTDFPDSDKEVSGVFLEKFIFHFTKATKLSQSVFIKMKSEWPIVIEYIIPNIGFLSFSLSPSKQETKKTFFFEQIPEFSVEQEESNLIVTSDSVIKGTRKRKKVTKGKKDVVYADMPKLPDLSKLF